MRPELRKTILLVTSALCLLTFLTGMVIAQTVREEKKTLSQANTRSQFSYQKMVQTEACTQQMAQNRYTYEQKVQNKNANRKMTKTGGGNSETQGQQDSHGNGNGSSTSGGSN